MQDTKETHPHIYGKTEAQKMDRKAEIQNIDRKKKRKTAWQHYV